MTGEDARLRAEPDLLRNAGFSPNFCSQAGGAARGVKACEEFGEARAALIRFERPSRGSKANPKSTSWGRDSETIPRDPFGVREPLNPQLLGGEAKSSRPLLTGIPRWLYGARGHQTPVGSWCPDPGPASPAGHPRSRRGAAGAEQPSGVWWFSRVPGLLGQER